MCSLNKQLPNVIGVGPQWATANVRQKATVVCEVRGSRSNERLMYEPRDLKGTLHSVEKTLIQKAYCVYYYILKERRFFMSINSVVDFSLNFK